jgi:hypothetical protein
MTQGMAEDIQDPVGDLQTLVSALATDFAANQFKLSELEADNQQLVESVGNMQDSLTAQLKKEAEYLKQLASPANSISYQTSLLTSVKGLFRKILASLPTPIPFLCETFLKMDEEIIDLKVITSGVGGEIGDWQSRLKRAGEVQAEREEVERRIEDELEKIRQACDR